MSNTTSNLGLYKPQMIDYPSTTIPQLASNFDVIDSSLADIPNKSFNSSLVKQHISKAFQGKGNGMALCFIGDSISQGVGASDISKSYVSNVFSALNSVLNKGIGSGYELTANFQAPPAGFTYSGSTSYGMLGPAKKSLIMQPGSTITFTRNPYWLELYYHQTPTSGKIQFSKDGTVYRTLDCSGVDTLDVNSFASIVNLDSQSHQYTLTCLNAPVEITGVECWSQTTTASIIYEKRFAVSGTTSGYWNDPNVLASIKNVGTNGDKRQSVFVIALGTNDCYQSGGAVPSATYQSNMTSIINSLQADGHYIVLVAPPRADETKYPALIEPYTNYVQGIKNLAQQFNLPYTDLSTIDFVGKGWLVDGVHPNDTGHYAIAKYHMDTLGIPQVQSIAGLSMKTNSLTIEVSSFTHDTGNANYNIGVNIPTTALITGIYILNKTNGLKVPYQDYIDYANNIGLYVQKDYPSVGTKLYYPDVTGTTGFIKTGRGPLGSLVTNVASNCQIIVEYITS